MVPIGRIKWVDPFRGKSKVNFPDSFAIDCSSFVYPIVIDSMARITSKYGPRRRRMHKGIDLKVLKGDTIRTSFDGKVRIKGYERRGIWLLCRDSSSQRFGNGLWTFVEDIG